MLPCRDVTRAAVIVMCIVERSQKISFMAAPAKCGQGTQEFPDTYVNSRGIPRVTFIENVDQYVKNSGYTAETVLRQIQEQYSKYKLMETRLVQNLASLRHRLPQIQKTLDAVTFLKQRETEGHATSQVNFALTEAVFGSANVQPQGRVHLWLGANVMVEYTFDEAIALLQKNLAGATANLESTDEDLSWLRDQQVILEVNTSRVYNYDVVKRREAKEGGAPAA